MEEGAPCAHGPLERCADREVAFDMLQIAGMRPACDGWLNAAVALVRTEGTGGRGRLGYRGRPGWESGALRDRCLSRAGLAG